MKHIDVDEMIRFVSLTTWNSEASDSASAVTEGQQTLENNENIAVQAQDLNDPACTGAVPADRLLLINRVNAHIRECVPCRKAVRQSQDLFEEYSRKYYRIKPKHSDEEREQWFLDLIKKQLENTNLTQEEQEINSALKLNDFPEMAKEMFGKTESGKNEFFDSRVLLRLTDELLDTVASDECGNEDFSEYFSEYEILDNEPLDGGLLDQYLSQYKKQESDFDYNQRLEMYLDAACQENSQIEYELCAAPELTENLLD